LLRRCGTTAIVMRFIPADVVPPSRKLVAARSDPSLLGHTPHREPCAPVIVRNKSHCRLRPVVRTINGSAKALPRITRRVRRKPEAYATAPRSFTVPKALNGKLDIPVSGGGLVAPRGPGEVVWGHFAEPTRRIG